MLTFFRAFFLLMLLTSMGVWAPTAQAQTVHKQYFDGRVTFKVKADQTTQVPQFADAKAINLAELPEPYRTLVQEYSITSLKTWDLIGEPTLKPFFDVRFTEIARVDELMEALRALPYVELVELEPLMYKHSVPVPNDYDANALFHLNRIMTFEGWNYIVDNNLPQDTIKLAIVDDAVFITHEDLAANIYRNPDEIPANGVDDDGNGFRDDVNGWDVADNDNDPMPPTGSFPVGRDFTHGTHTTGCAALVSNNGVGYASVTLNLVKIIPVKATRSQNSSQFIEEGYAGIQYAVAAGADVMSLSWGGNFSSSGAQAVINAALARGIKLFASAGNDNVETASYPCNFNGVICVAATTASDTKTSYSEYGSKVDICAPGDLMSSLHVGALTSSYGVQSGTSMSSPLAAGMGSVFLSTNKNMTNKEFEFYIKCGCDNIDGLNPTFAGKLGSGRVNLIRTLHCTLNVPCGADTLTDHLAGGTPGLLTFATPDSGYAVGTNLMQELGFIERFDDYVGRYTLRSFRVKFDKVTADPNSQAEFTFRVLAANPDGTPGGSIASQRVKFSDVAANLVNGWYTITFASPVNVSTRFYAGIQFDFSSFGAADTVPIAAINRGTGGTDTTAYVRAPGGSSWVPFASRRGYNANFAIEPVIYNSLNSTTTADITAPSTNVAPGTNLRFTATSNQIARSLVTFRFPDGTERRGADTASFKFNTPGTYTVYVWVHDGSCAKQDSISITVTPATAVADGMGGQVAVYPNPGNGAFTVFLNGVAAGPATLSLLTLTGQEVYTEAFTLKGDTMQHPVALPNLASGIYIVRLTTPQGQLTTKWIQQ